MPERVARCEQSAREGLAAVLDTAQTRPRRSTESAILCIDLLTQALLVLL